MKKEILLGLLFFSLLVTPTLAVQRGGPGNSNGEYFTGSMEVRTVTINGTVEITNTSASVTGPKFKVTPEGGYAIRLTNKTGGVTVKGNLVTVHPSIANAFTLTSAASLDCIGAVYQAGVADGSECYIVVSGIAEVLFATSTTPGSWVQNSNSVGGQADGNQSYPSSTNVHFLEVGHSISTVSAGQLGKIIMHFN